MDVCHINAFDLRGGAARAAYRVHKALLKYQKDLNINSKMRVLHKSGDDITVVGGRPQGTSKIWTNIVPYLNRLTRLGYKTDNPIIHSTAWFKTGLGKELNLHYKKNMQEIINLHWLGDLTISIKEIGKIKQPLVWTLHDQWAFCGAEHYENIYSENQDLLGKRYIDGYLNSNRPINEKGLDINKMVWKNKKKYFKNPINMVCGSEWLADCVKKSALMRSWPVEVIPVPIDLDIYYPMDKALARKILNLPIDKPLILFGAIGGLKDPRKGTDLLFKALNIIKEKEIQNNYFSKLEILIFGESDQKRAESKLFPTHYLGHLYDDISLRILYSAADLLIVPSRLEALGLTGIEAHACGTPVVAFNYGGPIDVIENKVTGALANPFDSYSLAAEIKWVLENKSRNIELGINARKRAENIWSEKRVAGLYKNFYKKVLSF